jgi:hypothetical protein
VGVNDANFNRAFDADSNDINYSRAPESKFKKFEIVKRLLPIYRYINQSLDSSAPVYARHKPAMYNLESYTEASLRDDTKNLTMENTKKFKERFKMRA